MSDTTRPTPTGNPSAPPLRSRVFDYGVLATALGALAAAVVTAGDALPEVPTTLTAVPLIAIIARFPLVLDKGDGGVEVGFDSCVLMYLLCSVPPAPAFVVWALGVIGTQVTNDKRTYIKLFNIGVGVLGGGVATLLFVVTAGPLAGRLEEVGDPRVLAAVLVAAAAYFVSDFVVSAGSVALEERTALLPHLTGRGALIAVACFVPFNSLGYLAAVIDEAGATWTMVLLGVPLATLLIATRAVTRGGENARRLRVLFDAAVQAQTLSDTRQVHEALIGGAKNLLRMRQVEQRSGPPSPHEIGAVVHDGVANRWLVAPGRHRARSTKNADQEALNALVAVASDAFARLRLTDDMTHLARHDLLTNLPNRGVLLDRVDHALHLSRRRGTSIALLFVDLDGFKSVNDRFGHASGDAVLIDFTQRLTACVRESDTVARLGGDEFAVLLEDIGSTEADTACDRILRALSAPVVVAGHRLELSASVGVAFGESGDSSEGMLRNADLAMYEAKAHGKNQYAVYESALGRSRLQRLELVEALRASLAAGDLDLVYQPVLSVETGLVTGVEALARWRSNGVDVRPDVFIKVAEESGLIISLGDLVLAKAARDALAMLEAASRPLTVSVNISARQMREPDFVDKVTRAQSGMGSAGLVLEITERDMVGDDSATLEAMSRLDELGVAFAIDDFGVGFSSIGYLQDMPVRIIKTDLSFSGGIDRDERSCALLSSITMMGQALGLDVVVEGIERPAQLDHVRDHVNAPMVQGYLLHRPMPLERLVEVLRHEAATPRTGAGGGTSVPGGSAGSAQRPASGTSSITTSSL